MEFGVRTAGATAEQYSSVLQLGRSTLGAAVVHVLGPCAYWHQWFKLDLPASSGASLQSCSVESKRCIMSRQVAGLVQCELLSVVQLCFC